MEPTMERQFPLHLTCVTEAKLDEGSRLEKVEVWEVTQQDYSYEEEHGLQENSTL